MFCNKCDHIFGISKLPFRQSIPDFSEVIAYILDNIGEEFELSDFNLQGSIILDLTNSPAFSILKKKEKNIVMQALSDLPELPEGISTNDAYYVCPNCHYSKKIVEGSIIYQVNKTDVETSDVVDYSWSIYDDTLPRTSNFNCPNKQCPTYKAKTREAVITKTAAGQVVHVCVDCKTQWIGV